MALGTCGLAVGAERALELVFLELFARLKDLPAALVLAPHFELRYQVRHVPSQLREPRLRYLTRWARVPVQGQLVGNASPAVVDIARVA